jgi:RimJ/RimL family protein N-acetyltransferase
LPAIPDLIEPLSDGRIALRFAAERDIPEVLIAHEDDRQMYVRLGMDRPPSGAELGRFMEEDPGRRASGDGVTLTIVEPSADVCLGRVNAHHIDWEHARADVGIWLAPGARGQGLGRGALGLAAGWLFNACSFERLQILTEPDNEPMLHAALAAGFVREGLLRAHVRERGARVDCAILSLLPSDLGAT